MDCPFCTIDRPTVIENEHAIAILDAYPVSEGHTLVIPREHVADITELSEEAYSACFRLVRLAVDSLRHRYEVNGLNIGVNIGEAAGQTVFHAHIHVIPRFLGDVDNPRGGVRGVIPAKQQY